MSADVMAVLSSAVLVALWAWTGYHAAVFVVGWFRSRDMLRRPFRADALRNPVDLPTVSIIVAAKNEANVIGSLLEEIAALRYPPSLLQVVVAEDGSTDRTRDMCEAFARTHSQTLVLHEDASSGKAAALNRATRYATGEVLLFLDADTRFDSDLLLRSAKFFHDHPDVDAAQALIGTYTDRPNVIAKLDRYETAIWFRGILAGKDRLGLFVPLCGAGMFIRKRALDRAGEWNPKSLAEDVEMAARLAATGAKIRVLDARVWRQPPYSVRDFLNQRERLWGGAVQLLPTGLRLLRSREISGRSKGDLVVQLASPFVFFAAPVYLVATVLQGIFRGLHSEMIVATLLGIGASQVALVGLVVAHSISRRTARDLDLIPGLYLYWALGFLAIVTASIGLALGRPPRWRVTAKRRVPADPKAQLSRNEPRNGSPTTPIPIPAVDIAKP